MAQKVWKIRGYAGLELIFEQSIAAGSLSEQEITALLQRLASRHLSDNEVVSASLRKNARGYAPHLEVLPNTRGTPGLMTTSTDYNYTATIEDGK